MNFRQILQTLLYNYMPLIPIGTHSPLLQVNSEYLHEERVNNFVSGLKLHSLSFLNRKMYKL